MGLEGATAPARRTHRDAVMTSEIADSSPTVLRQLAIWAARAGLANKLALLLTVAALAAGVATYLALTESPAPGGDADTVYLLLNLDLAKLLQQYNNDDLQSFLKR